uniref:Leucine rich repeat containing 63 n=1 Tax=Molossus molossus TaxID=27622 RepID=A0A7J8GL35_MOLMO|nr:leucine rich repeat containing 63 [Molossus molossus]
MQNHPKLLRRPLPPKFPKLPLYKKKVHTVLAKTDKIEPPHEKFAQDEITLIGGNKTSFPDVVSRKQLQTSVNIQNISLHYQVQRRVAAMLTPYRSSKNVYWSIPETAAGSIIFPSWPSASRRIFGKERKQMERSRKPKEEPLEIKTISVDDPLKGILILSSEFSKPSHAPSPVISPKLKEVSPECCTAYTFKHPLIDLSTTTPSAIPRIMPVPAKKKSDHLQQNMMTLLSISHFSGTALLPAPVLPRKPQRQSVIETQITENENSESVPKQGMPTPSEGHIKSRKQDEAMTNVIRGEGFNIIDVTKYETIAAMANLAVVNCQIHGRNALNLKGFFILNCPDLTSLASQLIYLNLSFNDISSFPTEVSLCLLCIY